MPDTGCQENRMVRMVRIKPETGVVDRLGMGYDQTHCVEARHPVSGVSRGLMAES